MGSNSILIGKTQHVKYLIEIGDELIESGFKLTISSDTKYVKASLILKA
jgi:hypothetical protein